MMKVFATVAAMLVVTGCAATQVGSKHTVTVKWQRLVDERGQTCQRCGTTQDKVRQGAQLLRRCLRPLNMQVVLEETPLDPETVARDVSESNRIFLDGRPLEDWLHAKEGRSLCGSCCDQLGTRVECRTTVVDGRAYEAIPAVFIVRAGLLAADAALAADAPPQTCCP